MEVPNIDNLIADLIELSEDLSVFKTRIAKTNARHGLTDKIHEMEALRSTISRLEPLARNKQQSVHLNRLSYDGPAVPVPTYATYDVETLVETVDGLRDRVRVLDMDLQRLNWEIDLEE